MYLHRVLGRFGRSLFAMSALKRGGGLALSVVLAVTAARGAEEQTELALEVGDLRFRAIAAGPEDGQLVLLLHGFPQTSYAFRRLMPRLAAEGYRAVAPDQRGYSPGARPAKVEAYAMPHLVASSSTQRG